MTLKRQSVQRLSYHKKARTFCVSQERGIVERMVWSKTNGRSLLSGAEKEDVWGGWGGERLSYTGEAEAKNTSKKYDRNCKEK